MTLTDQAQTLSDAIEEYGPEEGDDIVVSLLQFDEMANPISSDLFTKIAGWNSYDDIGLMPPKVGITYHYVDQNGDQFTTREMLDGEPEWFDPPEEEPEWARML
jgi:hypothetical protein